MTRIDDILGLVRLCRRCGEEWPVDDTFWFFDRKGKVLGHCKACWSERVFVDGRKVWPEQAA